MFGIKAVLFVLFSLHVATSQHLSPDGLLNFYDLKLQNEKLTEIIADLNARIEGFAPAVNQTCLTLKRNYPGAVSGVHDIYPVFATTAKKTTVYCDLETLDGGWTLVQRTVWNFTDSKQLITGYDDFLRLTLGDPNPNRAFRLAGQYWPGLSQLSSSAVDHLFKFYLRDEPSAECSASEIDEGDAVMVATPLIHGSIGTRWFFPPVQDESSGVSVLGNSASFGAAPKYLFNTYTALNGFVTETASYAGNCPPEKVNPFHYADCCNNCPLFDYEDSVWPDNLSHPMISTSNIATISDLNGFTCDDVTSYGGCSWKISPSYLGAAVVEYFIR